MYIYTYISKNRVGVSRKGSNHNTYHLVLHTYISMNSYSVCEINLYVIYTYYNFIKIGFSYLIEKLLIK